MKKNYIILLMLLPVFLVLMHCGDKGITYPEDHIGDAWNLFIDGDYEASRDKFQTLIVSEGERAYVGLGWSNLRLGNIAAANVNFDSVPNLSGYENSKLANAGWTFVKWGLEEYSSSITKANFVMVEDPAFSFKYDLTVNFSDLILIQAYSYFHLAAYEDCINRIKELDNTFTATPADENIAEILLIKLEALKNIYD